jgi:protein-disulfide isomerase
MAVIVGGGAAGSAGGAAVRSDGIRALAGGRVGGKAGGVTPDNTFGEGGTTVRYGRPDATRVLDVFADLRCPYCKRMENGLGETMQALADQAVFSIHYHFATFLDDATGGRGSHVALNALGAAADAGQAPFMAYLRELYLRQPPEDVDDFADPEVLLSVADGVKELRGERFDQAVRGLAYRDWVDRVSAAFEASGVSGTPTVLLNGARVAVLGRDGEAVSPAEFTAQIP